MLDTRVLLTRSHPLPGGQRVRLRLARSRDRRELQALVRAANPDCQELDVVRLIRFDPRRRVAMCATALVGGAETVVGVGAIDIDAQDPDTLCVDHEFEGLPELLTRALASRARVIANRSAA